MSEKKPLPSRWECANCSLPEQPGVILRPCSRCKLVRYCGTECQAQHWKKGGHKQNCVAPDQRKPESAAGEAGKGPECAICLCKLTDKNMMTLRCSHAFHSGCVERLRDASASPSLCPLCRAPIAESPNESYVGRSAKVIDLYCFFSSYRTTHHCFDALLCGHVRDP